jgi:hypothetical protein
MTRTQSNVKRLAAPILLGLLVLLGACAPAEPAPYGISFYPPSVGYIGRQYTPTATASSGLPVSFALDASSTGCSYVGGVLSFNGVGTCVVNANQAGDATNPPAPQVWALDWATLAHCQRDSKRRDLHGNRRPQLAGIRHTIIRWIN